MSMVGDLCPSEDGTCAISSLKDRVPILRLLKQSRDGAAPTITES